MLEKLAHADSWTILLGLFVVTFLLSWLLSLTWDRGKALTESEKLKVSPKKSMSFFSFVVVILLLIIVVLILSVTRLYTAFTTHELVAVVKCLPANGYGKDAFELVYTPVSDGEMAEEQRFIIRGENWSLGGDILEWESYLNFLGLHTMYRLTRLQGRYAEAEDEMTHSITAYPLVEDEKNEFWDKLYDIAVKTPFIKSAHQNFVSTYPFFGDYFQVYVTPTGYTLERFEGNEGN